MKKYHLSFESVVFSFLCVVREVYETCLSSLTFIGQYHKTADLGHFGFQVFLLSKGLRVLVSYLNFHTEDFKRYLEVERIVDGD